MNWTTTSIVGSTSGWTSISANERDQTRHPRNSWWLSAPAAFIVLLYVVPLLGIITWAFTGSDRGAVGTLRDLFASPYYRSRIAFTFAQAALSTLATLVIGLPLSYILATRAFPLRRLLRAALTVPFVMPPLVLALALQTFLGPRGLFDAVLGSAPLTAFGPVGAIVLAHVLYNVSLVVRIVGATWQQIPATLSEAAATLGASPTRILWSVRIPLAVPAILASSILVFLFCATSFGVILLLGGERVGTLETLIYDEVASFRPHYDVAAVLGTLQLLTTLVAVLLYVLVSRASRPTYTPNVHGTRTSLRKREVAILTLGAALVLGPFLALFAEAFRYQGRWSFAPVELLFSNTLPLGSYNVIDALGNSLLFALLTVLIAVPLSWASLQAFRTNPRARATWTTFLLLPLGTSAVLLGLGYLLVFDGSPLPDLRAHPARIVLAHALIAFPFTTRILAPGFGAMNPSLLDAARTLGAGALQLFLRIELPLLRPSLLAAAVFAFAVSLGEFGAALLLRRPEWTTLPLALFDAYSRPGEGFRAQAEVLAVLLAAVAMLAFWLLEHLRRGSKGSDLL